MRDLPLGGCIGPISSHLAKLRRHPKAEGSKAREASKDNVLVNEIPVAYDILRKTRDLRKGGRIDIALDNAGFELYVDIFLAGYLLSAELATTVVLHPKSIPWFISDTIPADFKALLQALRDPQSCFSSSLVDNTSEHKTPNLLSENDLIDLKFV